MQGVKAHTGGVLLPREAQNTQPAALAAQGGALSGQQQKVHGMTDFCECTRPRRIWYAGVKVSYGYAGIGRDE